MAMIKIHDISLLIMKKDKKIKELDDWLEKIDDKELADDEDPTLKEYEYIMLDTDFDSISLIDDNKGKFAYRTNGVQDSVINKLKKMKLDQIEYELDLHGETVKDAVVVLNDFFSYAYTHNIEYIKIICGKGRNSKDNVPRIKITAQAFIKKSNIVRAACSASDNEGGIGVLKVRLKK